MQIVNVELAERSYKVYIDSGILGTPNLAVDVPVGSVVLIVSNQTVAPLYLETLMKSFEGADVNCLILPDGESFKTSESWLQIIDKLTEIRATRDATLITLGGGVIGDMGGFAAASYMRGIRFVQVPTSLLAQVDASVGGKTGINHVSGKNLIGAFHQPAAVIIDIDTLKTLPDREFAAGMAEVVKIAAIRDADFLHWLESNIEKINSRDSETLREMISLSVTNKAAVVAEDERETGVRALLNFGHSFAHALETLTGYTQYLHGEAVAIGMMVACSLSEQRGICEPGIRGRLGCLLRSFGLPLELPRSLEPSEFLEAMKLDKKTTSGSLVLILIKMAGQGVIDRSSDKLQIATAILANQTNSEE